MSLKHLTDEQIQAYLDREPGMDLNAVAEHVQQCSTCQSALEQYKAIYSGLSLEPEFRLPDAFVNRVLFKIEYAAKKKKIMAGSIAASFVTLSLVVGLLFVDPTSLVRNSFAQLDKSIFGIDAFKTALGFVQTLNVDYIALVMGLLIVALLAIIDSYLSKNQKRLFSSFFSGVV